MQTPHVCCLFLKNERVKKEQNQQRTWGHERVDEIKDEMKTMKNVLVKNSRFLIGASMNIFMLTHFTLTFIIPPTLSMTKKKHICVVGIFILFIGSFTFWFTMKCAFIFFVHTQEKHRIRSFSIVSDWIFIVNLKQILCEWNPFGHIYKNISNQ